MKLIIKDDEGELIYETSTMKLIEEHQRDWPRETPRITLKHLFEDAEMMIKKKLTDYYIDHE
tara:strand:- start:1012 stop:1197 length:186 start_codon:yes stop_codon:yes gene_type:complete